MICEPIRLILLIILFICVIVSIGFLYGRLLGISPLFLWSSVIQALGCLLIICQLLPYNFSTICLSDYHSRWSNHCLEMRDSQEVRVSRCGRFEAWVRVAAIISRGLKIVA